MSHCLNCRGECYCKDPIVPGRDATYDPDRGGWVSWDAWREYVKSQNMARERARRDPVVAKRERRARR